MYSRWGAINWHNCDEVMICSGAAFDGMEKLVLFLGFGHKIDLLHHQFETLTPSLLEWRPDLFNPSVRVQSNNLSWLDFCHHLLTLYP